jgi:hypothetical protein
MPPAEREDAMAAVMAEILADSDAGTCTTATLYQDFSVRCRIRQVGGEAPSLSEFKRRLSVARAGVDREVAATPAWEDAQAIAAGLPDDLAGLFLLVTRAAIEGAPCPSDKELADAYGTSSAGRARRMLAYLEERGAIVTRRDLRGAPIIAVPELGVETRPGEPDIAANRRGARAGRG